MPRTALLTAVAFLVAALFAGAAALLTLAIFVFALRLTLAALAFTVVLTTAASFFTDFLTSPSLIAASLAAALTLTFRPCDRLRHARLGPGKFGLRGVGQSGQLFRELAAQPGSGLRRTTGVFLRVAMLHPSRLL
jgi:hypothetical protein